METIRAIREARLAGKPFTRYEDFASRETAACLQQVNEAVNAGYGADCQPAGGDSRGFPGAAFVEAFGGTRVPAATGGALQTHLTAQYCRAAGRLEESKVFAHL